jgi:hypothetical protein
MQRKLRGRSESVPCGTGSRTSCSLRGASPLETSSASAHLIPGRSSKKPSSGQGTRHTGLFAIARPSSVGGRQSRPPVVRTSEPMIALWRSMCRRKPTSTACTPLLKPAWPLATGILRKDTAAMRLRSRRGQQVMHRKGTQIPNSVRTELRVGVLVEWPDQRLRNQITGHEDVTDVMFERSTDRGDPRHVPSVSGRARHWCFRLKAEATTPCHRCR